MTKWISEKCTTKLVENPNGTKRQALIRVSCSKSLPILRSESGYPYHHVSEIT
ncbi:hypothetical protein ACG2QI_00290 [Bacillus sp. GM2]|uniref:hypothetical protein n=1 Tax=Bacillus sp. GM2 TaxID=3373599 RepID=UPI003F8F2EF5